jgi:hypothetical protein
MVLRGCNILPEIMHKGAPEVLTHSKTKIWNKATKSSHHLEHADPLFTKTVASQNEFCDSSSKTSIFLPKNTDNIQHTRKYKKVCQILW